MVRIPESEQERILLDLLIALQHAVDLDTVLAHLLAAVTSKLDFKQAIVTLIDQELNALHPWMQQTRESETAVVLKRPPLSLENGPESLLDVLKSGEAVRLDLGKEFGINTAMVLPMFWGAAPIGLLLVDLAGHENDVEECTTLRTISEHTAVTIGMMQTRHRRAKDSAIQDERARLALDLHDTVSQSLFGLVFALEACVRMLPEDPQAIRPELEWALKTAEEVRRTIRATVSDLWPEELTAEQFEADLRSYAAEVLQAAELDLVFDIRGNFSALSPPVRRSLYRICQEALTNVVHHAGAGNSRICVDVSDGRAQSIIRDDGRGFDLQEILNQPYSENHFGLRGMQERATALGGTCRIYSQPGAGTSIVIDLPANLQDHHQESVKGRWDV
jgi:nitrate/nitrite-specific signal transduction histidine kinase